MYKDDNKLLKKLVMIVSIKIMIVFFLWWVFIRGNHVDVDTDVVNERLFNEVSSQPVVTPHKLLTSQAQSLIDHTSVWHMPVKLSDYRYDLFTVIHPQNFLLPELTSDVVPVLFSPFVVATLPSSQLLFTQMFNQHSPSTHFTTLLWQASANFSSAIFAKEAYRDY